MESQPPKSFADVLQRCTTFLRPSHRWAARKYTAEFLADVEHMREREHVAELTSMLEQCSCEEIAQLHEIALQFVKAAVAIAADVVVQRGDAEEACMKPLMIVYNKIVDEFKAVSIDKVDWSDFDDAPEDKKVYMYGLLHMKEILMTSRANRDELTRFLQHCSIDKVAAKLSSGFEGCPAGLNASPQGDRPIAPVNPRETGSASVVEPVTVVGPSTSSAGQVSEPPAARKEEATVPPVKVEPGSCEKSTASVGAATTSATKSNIIIISDALVYFSSKLRTTTRRIQLKFVPEVDNPNPIEWLLSGFQDIVNCIVRGRENTYVGVNIQCSGEVLLGTASLPFRPAAKLSREIIWDLFIQASESIDEDINVHEAMEITVQYVEAN